MLSFFNLCTRFPMKADCFAPLALTQEPPVFAIRADALLAHTGLPVRYPPALACKHAVRADAGRDFHGKMC